MDRQTKTTFRTYNSPGQSVTNFNAIRFINKGSVTATVNSFPIAPGESMGWAHNRGEIDTGVYTIDFPSGNTGAILWAIIIYFKDTDN